MEGDRGRSVYEGVGVRPVINASGFQLTMLGGQILSPRVTAAMEQANAHFVDMKALLRCAGEAVAGLVGAEAAYVTTGCCSAMALSAAACMAGMDPSLSAQLPDTRGMPDEILIQATQRYKYERCVTVSGARLVEVGDASGVSAAQLEAAISERTAAILAVASRPAGSLPLEEVLAIAKRRGVPIILDAAGQVYPPERLQQFPAMGVDITTHSAKYFGGPNSTGFLCGRRDLVEAAAYHGFISFEYGPPFTIGRPMKLDRQEIVALVEALREWLTMDHRARFAAYAERAERLRRCLDDIPGVAAALDGDPVTGVRVTLDEAAIGAPLAEIVRELHEGEPSVWLHYDDAAYVRAQPGGTMRFSVMTLVEGDAERLAARLREVVTR